MFNLRNPTLPDWPHDLAPVGEGSMEKETFERWLARHGPDLHHLHPQLLEQWVYRHWTHSRFSFLPLEHLTWKMESWDSARVLRDVVRYGHERTPFDPDFDYKTFQRRGGEDRHATARALDEGTWDYPLVTLETPSGFVDAGREMPDARFVLIEGHQRMRYLNALFSRGHAPLGPHQVFVLACGVPL